MDATRPLRILIVEDNELDRALVLRELKKSGDSFSISTADDRESFYREFEAFAPELILCDFSLPGFNAFEVLDTVTSRSPDTPVIIVTGTLTDETAVECLKRGALDYVLKDKILRLVPAIRRAMELKSSRLERRRYQEDLETAKAAADAANEAKSQFLANMSHEMRTPLSAMLGFAELILAPNQSADERRRFAEKIVKNCQRLRVMIDEILDLSKVEAGKLQIDKSEFSVTEFVAQLQSMLSALATENHIALKFRLAGAVRACVNSDQVKLRHILVNIIGNAIKFSRGGVVDVTISMIGGSVLAFTVKDSGRGMTERQIEHLFEPFMQVDSSMTRKLGGTGLGLTLARKFARALGGDVVLLETSPERGSTFQVTIDPGTTTKTDTITTLDTTFATHDDVPATTGVDLHGVRILLVEDSPDNQFLMRRFLETAGAAIDVANNGEEGVDRAMHHDYDLVLMDIQMPVLDGYHATSRLRDSGYDRPIVALTAHALREEREKCLRLGFTGFLTKPIRKDDLLKEVDGLRA